MANRKNKKRNKRYTGEDAKPLQPASEAPVIHRYEAVDRGAARQWWFEKKRTVKIVAGATGVVALAGWLLFELFQILL